MSKRSQSLLLLIAMLAVVLVLPACSPTPVRYVSHPLPLPVRQTLPAVSAEELSCLSGDTYRRLVDRDRLRREYAEELEVIIGATRIPASDSQTGQ